VSEANFDRIINGLGKSSHRKTITSTMPTMDGHRRTMKTSRKHHHPHRRLLLGLVVVIVCCCQWRHSVEAYPNFMLTASNCYTTLSTEEVIMNFPVVSVAMSDDPAMQIMNLDDPAVSSKGANKSKIVQVGVRTTNPKTNRDYQFILDIIEGECTFEGGGCDEKKRIGGRAKDVVKVRLPDQEGAVCTLQAGWAAGHEAVRLTPLLDVGAVPEDNDEEEDEEEEALDGQVEEKNDEEHEEEITHYATLEDPAAHAADKKRKHYQENLLHYEIGFDSVGMISWTGYLRGAIFLLVAPSLAVLLCLKLSKWSTKQTRRDL
jgi:hypothetical protein